MSSAKGFFRLAAICLSVFVCCGCGNKNGAAQPGANGDPDPLTVACGSFLNRIEQAKKAWAQQRGAGANDTPTADDLLPYFRQGMPKCPSGGTYTIGTVSELPQCSIAAHNEFYKANMAPP